MSTHSLTPEQEQVVNHPLGAHARVLAVAGSGKSTTMAHHIRKLVLDDQVHPTTVQVLMFNALARKQFASHLDKAGLPANLQPVVHTFHSFSFQVINDAIKAGLLPANSQYWLADKAEFIWLALKRVINDLEKAKRIPPDAVDPELALHTISLWKSSLIPPDRAGSYASPYLPLVYAAFEQFRNQQAAITYDDFVPLAIRLLEQDPLLYRKHCGRIAQVIVDEYQDINLGQQLLIELLAGEDADVMVVGDDDQTIYEWRGARPNYILHDFARVFNGKPLMDYRLSRSFRFGPLIAQCAANVIACNSSRVDKPLIAFQAGKAGFVQIYTGGYAAIKELTDQVQTLVQADQVPPNQIVVLSRMYAQMNNLEMEFLSRRIPYRVDGQEPFYKRREISALLDYIRLADALQRPLDGPTAAWLVSVANKPSRMLSRGLLDRLCSTTRQQHTTVDAALRAAASKGYGLNWFQSRAVGELYDFLQDLAHQMTHLRAGPLLSWMVDELHYSAYLEEYYGQGETSDEKAKVVTNFVAYVTLLELAPLELLTHLEQLDTTQGKPEDELIVFTTIFRTKGLEFDYVLIPDCDENLLPYLKGERTDVYDTQGRVQEPQMSATLDNERRLFYVALTRARKGVYISTSSSPSRFLKELQLSETEPVMEVVRWLASGDTSASYQLQGILSNPHTYPALVNNLLSGYLPDLVQLELVGK